MIAIFLQMLLERNCHETYLFHNTLIFDPKIIPYIHFMHGRKIHEMIDQIILL